VKEVTVIDYFLILTTQLDNVKQINANLCEINESILESLTRLEQSHSLKKINGFKDFTADKSTVGKVWKKHCSC
jgi:hypothetical protein